jgi:ferredoxin
MRVTVDLDTCETYGECVFAAPEVFALDDGDEKVRVLDGEPDERQLEVVLNAARACPVAAITVEH